MICEHLQTFYIPLCDLYILQTFYIPLCDLWTFLRHLKLLVIRREGGGGLVVLDKSIRLYFPCIYKKAKSENILIVEQENNLSIQKLHLILYILNKL